MITVKVSGDLDFRRISAVRRDLMRQLTESDGLIVDMSDVKRIDSAGLAGLVELVQAARLSGRAFRLERIRETVRLMIAFARLDQVFALAEMKPLALAD